MKLKYLFLSFIAGIFTLVNQSCTGSENNLLDEPKEPETVAPDTLLVKIVSDLNVTEENLYSRSENSNDLIGVEITRKTSGSEWNAGVPTSVIYASGIFDDINDIVFKFVKGGTYQIKMTYFPNAKEIVYKNLDGTYGAPFSYTFGLKKYKLNQPVYYSGDEGGAGNGPVLNYLLDDTYQPTRDDLMQSFKRGETPRYSGQTDEIVINDDTNINIKLELCMMSITLKPNNFIKGKLSVVFRNYGYMDPKNYTWEISPNDEKVKKFQIPYGGGEESLELFYTNDEGEKYLLATKQLQHKYNTNYVFSFNLTERADGSIGIQMPTEDEMNDEDATFDF